MEKKKKFIIDVLFYGLIIILTWLFGKLIMPVLVPFILAFVISSIIRLPIRRLYGKSEISDKLLSVIVCTVFYALLFTAISFVGISAYHGISEFISSIPNRYNSDLVPALNIAISYIDNLFIEIGIDANISEIIAEHIGAIGEYITSFSTNAVKIISGGVTQVPGFIIKLVIMVISTFFCMIDYNKIICFFKKLIPKEKEEFAIGVLKYAKNTISLYAKSYFLLFMLTFVELSIGFLAMKIEHAQIIAMIVAIFDILPILGVGGVLLPWSAIGFITGDIFIGAGMLILYLIIAFIRNTAEPKLIGNQIGLHPLVTLIFMYLGLRFLGFFGMFLFPVGLSVIVGLKKEKDA